MPRLRTFLARVFFVLITLGASLASAEVTSPGTLIYNSAELSYLLLQNDADDGAIPVEQSSAPSSGIISDDRSLPGSPNVVFVSNVVRVGVGYLYKFSVENQYQLTQQAGSVVQFPHRIVNQGNALDWYEISFPELDTTAFSNPTVYLDLNHNGKIDSSEPELDKTTALVAGDGVDIIVAARVSNDLDDGVVKDFNFSVSSDNTTDVQKLTNTVTVGIVPLHLTVSSEPGCSAVLFPGDRITHTVNANKLVPEAFNPTPYLVDNQLTNGIIIELPVAENVSHVGFVDTAIASFPGIRVVKLDSYAEFEWSSADSLDTAFASSVVSTGFFIDPSTFSLGDVASFSVEREAVHDLDGQGTGLTEAIFDANSDGIPDVVSNSTCSRFTTLSTNERQSLSFVAPVSALKDAGTAPDFFNQRDFVNASGFVLNRGGQDLYSVVRDGLYLQLELGDLGHKDVQTDSAGNRYVVSTVSSALTGDVVEVVMLETEVAGVFRSIAPIELSTSARSDGGFCPAPPAGSVVVPVIEESHQACVLQSADFDQLTGTFGDIGTSFETAVLGAVSGRSIVFDSQTLEPVSGAVVQLIEADTGEVGVDLWTGKKFEFTTDLEGRYPLPVVLDSTSYYLQVDTPASHLFPSAVAAGALPDYTVLGFSYGKTGFGGGEDTGVFSGNWINRQSIVDIPLDPMLQIGAATEDRFLTIDKVATRASVDIGQSVSYTVSVTNAIDAPLVDVSVEDTMPFGFKYVPGSTLIRGEPAEDPTRTDDGTYIFDIDVLEVDETAEIRYALRTTAAAVDGDGVNTVVARGLTRSDNPTESIPARAKVKLQTSGVFSNQAALFGKVYVDQNCDGLQNNKEWPIGGVRLYLHDGTYVITDADGLFSLYGLNPGQYVVKLDPHTLPEGLSLKLLKADQAADPGSYFVQLSEGDFHRVDFAAVCPTSDVERVFADIKLRNRYLDRGWALDQAEDVDDKRQGRLQSQLSRATGSDGDLSNGVIDGPDGISTGDTATDEDAKDQIESLYTDQEGTEKEKVIPDPKEVVSTITNAQAKAGTWLWPQQDLSITGRFIAVVRAGIDPTLYVNDRAVEKTQIGEQLVNRREKAQIIAWYGVELDEGENVVEVRGNDQFGNERILAEKTFQRPTSGTQIKLVTATKSIAADGGRSVLPIKVQILDNNDNPALGVYFITLESSDGSFVEPDIQDSEPGRQIRVENGERLVHYRSSGMTGEVKIRASTSEYSDDLAIFQVAETRPLFVTGFVSGSYSISDRLGGFSNDTDLENLQSDSELDKRVAVFMKGQVMDNYNLTLSYDSAKNSREELFRDVDPALHYPIHGDSSIRGFEAQSRSKLYVKVERDLNSVMWGDFVTDPEGNQQDLARINRTLTGLNSVFTVGENNIRVFAAEEESSNIIEEIAGNGSALSYRLQQFPILPNSENIELITRSRENPGLVLSTVRLSRFGDYSLDDELGFLSFTSVIPTVDADQNPVFLRISYDVEQSDDSYIVSGVQVDRIVNNRLSVGGSVSYDGNDTDGMVLGGVYGDYKIGNKTSLSLGVASSDSNSLGDGTAHRVTVEHRWSETSDSVSSLTHASADENFSNSSVGVSPGRTETRLRHSRRLGKKSRLIADANRSASSTIDDERRTLSAVVETRVKDWDLRTGVSHISQDGLGGDQESFTTILGARRKFNLFGKDGSGDLEYEQDIGDAERKRITLGGKINLHEKVNAYGNYEFTNSLLGFGGFLNDAESESLTLGVESRILPSTRLYSEYRHRDVFDALQRESVVGIRGDYQIVEGLRFSPNFEYIRNTDAERSGASGSDSIAASIGIRDTRNPNSKKSLRLETRQSDDTDHYGIRASLVSRINHDWTAIVRDNFSRQDTIGADPVQRHSFTAAVARRPKYNNKHHMLFMYRFNQESGVTENVERSAHVLSTHQNFQVDSHTSLSGRVGFKKDNSLVDFSRISDFSVLIDTRAAYDLTRRLNLYVSAGALGTNNLSETRFSAGLGVDYTLNRNLRLNIGYNIVGFREEDLDIGDYNAKGARIGVQYKLDSELFKWLK